MLAVATLLATASASTGADPAANRCTRYLGQPSGTFNSNNCPPLTAWGTTPGGSQLWRKTSATARRNDNYIYTELSICSQHLHVRYSNGAGNHVIIGWPCLTWGGTDADSGGYAQSWCAVHSFDESMGVATTAQCVTRWTYP